MLSLQLYCRVMGCWPLTATWKEKETWYELIIYIAYALSISFICCLWSEYILYMDLKLDDYIVKCWISKELAKEKLQVQTLLMFSWTFCCVCMYVITVTNSLGQIKRSWRNYTINYPNTCSIIYISLYENLSHRGSKLRRFLHAWWGLDTYI